MTASPSPIPLLLLAAGLGRRMGGQTGGPDKLLLEIDGQPLLRNRAQAAVKTGQAVTVALPPRATAPARWSALEGLALRRLAVPGHREGMGASLAAAVATLPEGAPGALVLLADMPDLTTADLTEVIAAFDGATVTRGASAAGEPGHPVLLPARLLARARALTGDTGARALIAGEAACLVRLPGRQALTDLDTPEDLARWRAGRAPE